MSSMASPDRCASRPKPPTHVWSLANSPLPQAIRILLHFGLHISKGFEHSGFSLIRKGAVVAASLTILTGHLAQSLAQEQAVPAEIAMYPNLLWSLDMHKTVSLVMRQPVPANTLTSCSLHPRIAG